MIKIAILDYGHGGTDPGACSGPHIEKFYNLDTGKSTKQELEANGWLVFETRKGDQTLSLSERCRIANEIAKKYPGAYIVFVSIHHNAGKGDRAEAIYSIYEGEGKEVAILIAKELNTNLGQAIKTYSRKGTNNKDYYKVIRSTTMASTIVEVAFLDNTKDVTICDTYEERVRNGKLIAHGIIKAHGSIPISTKPPENNKPIPSKIKVGDKIKITGARYATGQTIPGWVKKNTYRVKQIKGDRALIDEIISWVFVKDLSLVSSSNIPEKPNQISTGSKVKVVGSRYATGQKVPSWVKSSTYTVQQIKGDKALLKEITSWVKLNDLRLI